MSERTSPRRRGWPQRLWRNIHLWLGIGLFVLLVPIALSGAILVYHDDIDEMMRTPREASVSQGPVDLPLAIANAKQAAGEKFQPTVVRFPENPRAPMTISLRGQAPKGQRPPFLTAYIDRNDSRVLNLVDFRASFFGFMHVFHENLTIPFYYGRDIVGWVGVAMLVLSLTGLYLWWPRHNQWSRAFVWRRSPATSSNLHYMTGFWVCLPLAFLSLTGIYLAWPQQGRSVLSTVAPITEQQRGGGGPQAVANTQLSPSEIYNIATARPNSAVTAIFFPSPQAGAWRVQLREEGKSEPTTILINDRSGTVSTVEPLAGDRIAFWIRWLHEGSHAGAIWRLIVFVTGLMPAVLGVTGILVWLRQRRQRALMKGSNHGQLVSANAPSGAISNTTPAE
jgi:uncharacterized iron-regulated membrane protein